MNSETISSSIASYKYIIINTDNNESHIFTNFRDLSKHLTNDNYSISAMQISRKFKNNNYFVFKNNIVKKLIW